MAAGDVDVSITTPDARQCAKFDGVDDFVNIPNSSSLVILNNITISLWSKLNTYTLTQYPDYIGRDTTNSQWTIRQRGDNNKTEFKVWTDTTNNAVVSLTATQLNTWQHAVGVYNGTDISLYINGVFQSSIALTGTINSTLSVIKFGLSGGGQYINSTINEVRIYNRALSAAEVMKLYGGEHITDGLWDTGR